MDEIARRKLSLLKLATEIPNVSQTCEVVGLLAPAVRRDSPQLPDLWRRGSGRPAAGAKGPHRNSTTRAGPFYG